jgi:hypothetical protein
MEVPNAGYTGDDLLVYRLFELKRGRFPGFPAFSDNRDSGALAVLLVSVILLAVVSHKISQMVIRARSCFRAFCAKLSRHTPELVCSTGQRFGFGQRRRRKQALPESAFVKRHRE